MSNVSSIAASGLAAATLRLEVSAGNIAKASSNDAGSSRADIPTQIIQHAAAKAAPPPTITALPAAYSPSFYAGAAGAGGTSVNVNLAYAIVQQIMARFGFSANSQAMKADARAVAAFLDITA